MAQPQADDQPDALTVDEGRDVERERIGPPKDLDHVMDRSDESEPVNRESDHDLERDGADDVDPDSPGSDVNRDDTVTD